MTKYKVTAATGFREHKEGDEFEAELDPGQEQRAIERGAIRAVDAKPKTKTKKEGTDDA